MYFVDIPYNEFREYLVEMINGPWGDNSFEETFGPFNEDGFIKITLWNGEVITFAKDLEDAKEAISEAVLAKKITEKKIW
jgi:hypothetical protein